MLVLKLGSFLGWNLKLAHIHGEQGETKDREAGHSRWVGGRSSKQQNLHSRLVLGGHKISIDISLNPPTRILSLYWSLTWVQSYIQSRWSQLHLAFSRLCPWKWLQLCEGWAEATFQVQGTGGGASDSPDPAHRSIISHILSMTSSNPPSFVLVLTIS